MQRSKTISSKVLISHNCPWVNVLSYLTPRLCPLPMWYRVVYRRAVEELLKETDRARVRAETMGPAGWWVIRLTCHLHQLSWWTCACCSAVLAHRGHFLPCVKIQYNLSCFYALFSTSLFVYDLKWLLLHRLLSPGSVIITVQWKVPHRNVHIIW